MIALLGGTFDPIHFGHLRPALDLYQDLPLDEVRFIPCRLPPHRRPPVASPELRREMVALAIEGEEGLRLDERELHRPTPSYTVDTLLSLREEFPDTPLCLIMGMDAFVSLDTWHRWRELIHLAHFIVVGRPGFEGKPHGEVQALWEARRAEDPDRLKEGPAGLILRWQVTRMDISATRIRTLLKAGKSPRYLLPEKVLELIEKRGVYL